jgi:hypothetical protein
MVWLSSKPTAPGKPRQHGMGCAKLAGFLYQLPAILVANIKPEAMADMAPDGSFQVVFRGQCIQTALALVTLPGKRTAPIIHAMLRAEGREIAPLSNGGFLTFICLELRASFGVAELHSLGKEQRAMRR